MSEEQSSSGYAKVIEKVYDDLLSPTLKEASKIGVDAVKVFRLALSPLQYGAYWQARLEGYFTKAINKVPEQNRISPVESLALPVAEKLKYQEESSPISELYVNLLARAMDKERVGEAHPAFIFIISQLAPAEIEILNHFYTYGFRILIRDTEKNCIAKEAELAEYLATCIPEHVKGIISQHQYSQQDIHQPEIFLTLIEHLYTLGLICYESEFLRTPIIASFYCNNNRLDLYPLEITSFGKLFYNACIKTD